MLASVAEAAGFRVALGFWGVAVPGVPAEEESLARQGGAGQGLWPLSLGAAPAPE